MKKIFALFALLSVIFAASCAPARADPLGILKKSFRAEIVIESNGCSVGGVVSLSEATEGGRELELTLTSPESVKGTVIKRADGKATATRGGLSFDADAFISVFELFMPDGAGEARIAELDGVKLTRVSYVSGGRSASVYLNGEGTPVLIESEGVSVKFVWFEPK